MARLAGDKPGYTFVLRDENTGRYVEDVSITLPSPTTIIKRTLAAPQLVGWAYRTTRDNISGMVSVLTAPDMLRDNGRTVLTDVLADADELEAYLASNRLRPDDIKDEGAERGKEGHAYLEHLGRAYLTSGEEVAASIAASTLSNSTHSTGWEQGIAQWWVDRNPRVVASEKVVWSLQGDESYCGSVDLIYMDKYGDLVVTDLKTREAKGSCPIKHRTEEAARKCHGRVPYDSDHAQVCAYAQAYEEMTGEVVAYTSVLIVTDDGAYYEEETTIPRDTFNSIVELDRKLRR